MTSGVMAMSKFDQRIALVTGGGRGMGRAIALALARQGAPVAVAARTASELEEVVSRARAEGGRVVPVTVDLADRQAARQLLPRVADLLGPVDILVNNAGVG